MKRCTAKMHYGDGLTVTCNQDASHDSRYCYLHTKYAEGLTAPIASKRPEENVTHITDRVLGTTIWSEVDDAVAAIAVLVA